MASRVVEIFQDQGLVERIKNRLPYLFELAELESSRGNKVGMEVGSLREKIIIALFIYKFGEENVETNIQITKAEIDVKIFGEPVSIKTITGPNLSGIKLRWTVDSTKAKEFAKSYQPYCDIVLVQVNWDSEGGFYYIPLESQQKVFDQLGRDKYIKLPKQGTNPRGIEITKEAMLRLVDSEMSKKIPVSWRKEGIQFSPYKRWIDLWRND